MPGGDVRCEPTADPLILSKTGERARVRRFVVVEAAHDVIAYRAPARWQGDTCKESKRVRPREDEREGLVDGGVGSHISSCPAASTSASASSADAAE